MLKTLIFISCYLLYTNLGISQTGEELRLVKKADSAYSFKEWGEKDDPSKIDSYNKAKDLYYQVLSSYPKNQYCQNRIIEIDRILSDFKYKTEYIKKIRSADSIYENNELEKAIYEYRKADSLISFVIDRGDRVTIKNRITICTDAIKIGIPDSSIAFVESVRAADDLYIEYMKGIASHNYNDSILDT